MNHSKQFDVMEHSHDEGENLADGTCEVCQRLATLRHVAANNLSCCYGILYPIKDADLLLLECEKTINYYNGDLAKVKVYGKWHPISRKQCAFGDPGMTYRFSGTSVPAMAWPPFVAEIRDKVSDIVGWKFNFALCNRYKDGSDFISEHKDNEVDLVEKAPIASLSLGFTRDFIFRHESVKLKRKQVKVPDTENIKLSLKTGSLLVMNYPTNSHWYHSLPKRAKVPGVRINFTFRVLRAKKASAGST